MKNVATIITIILLGFIPHLNATELSDALKYGEELGWNHKDTYRPYPILFIHGIGGHCTGWTDPNSSTFDLRPDPDDGMISKLLPYFEPYFKTKPDKKEKFSPYLKDITLSNQKKAKVYDKTYLETVEFSDNDGSIGTQTQELWHRIMGNPDPSGIRNPTSLSCDAYNYTIGRDVEGFEPLLQEYYPFRWNDALRVYEFQPEDKVILVGHSTGGLTARDYLTSKAVYGEDKHVAKLIMLQTPNLGASIAHEIQGFNIDNIRDAAMIGGFIGAAFAAYVPPVAPLTVAISAAVGAALAALPEGIKKSVTLVLTVSNEINPFTSEGLKQISPNSEFLSNLNARSKLRDVEYHCLTGVFEPDDSITSNIKYIATKSLIELCTGAYSKDKRLFLAQTAISSALEEIKNIQIEYNINLTVLHTLYEELKCTIFIGSKRGEIELKIKEIRKIQTEIEIKYKKKIPLPQNVKELLGRLKKINDCLAIISVVITSLLDKSDGIVPLWSQQFLETDGGKMSHTDVSQIESSAFHATILRGLLRGGYDGSIGEKDLLKQLDPPTEFELLHAGITNEGDEEKYIIEAKCYDFLPASTTVTLMLNGKVICDKNGKTIKDRPLSPLPLTKRYSHITEDGKYNSGFSFVINEGSIPDPEKGTYTLHVILRNPAGYINVDGSTNMRIEAPVYYETPFNLEEKDGTATITGPVPEEAINITKFKKPNPPDVNHPDYLVLPAPPFTQARVSHYYWSLNNPSDLMETWASVNKKVNQINKVCYSERGDYATDTFRHRVYLETITYKNEEAKEPKQIIIQDPRICITHKLASKIYRIGLTSASPYIYTPDINNDKQGGDDVVIQNKQIKAMKWSDIEPSKIYHNDVGALHILDTLSKGYDFVTSAIGSDKKPIVLTSYFCRRNYLKEYEPNLNKNTCTTFYKITLPPISRSPSPIPENNNVYEMISNMEIEDNIKEMLIGKGSVKPSRSPTPTTSGREVWRLFVNGERGDQWNADVLLMAYGNAMLNYYNPYYKKNKESCFPPKELNRRITTPQEAFLVGFCTWFSAAVSKDPKIYVGDTIYDLSGNPNNSTKGIDNPAAVAMALWQMNKPEAILSAALNPIYNTQSTSFNILTLGDELIRQGYMIDDVFQHFGLLPKVVEIKANIPEPEFNISSNNVLFENIPFELCVSRDIEFKDVVGTVYDKFLGGDKMNLVVFTTTTGLKANDYYYRISIKAANTKMRTSPVIFRVRIKGTNTVAVDDSNGVKFTTEDGKVTVDMPAGAVGDDYTISVGKIEDNPEIEEANNSLKPNRGRIKGLTREFIIIKGPIPTIIQFPSDKRPEITLIYRDINYDGIEDSSRIVVSSITPARLEATQWQTIPQTAAINDLVNRQVRFYVNSFSVYGLIGTVLGSISLSPKEVTLQIGQTATFTTNIYDIAGGEIDDNDISVEWHVKGGKCDAGKRTMVYQATYPGTWTLSARIGTITAFATIVVIGEPKYEYSETKQIPAIDLGEISNVTSLNFKLELPGYTDFRIRYRTALSAQEEEQRTTKQIIDNIGKGLPSLADYYNELNRVMTEDLGITAPAGPGQWSNWSNWHTIHNSSEQSQTMDLEVPISCEAQYIQYEYQLCSNDGNNGPKIKETSFSWQPRPLIRVMSEYISNFAENVVVVEDSEGNPIIFWENPNSSNFSHVNVYFSREPGELGELVYQGRGQGGGGGRGLGDGRFGGFGGGKFGGGGEFDGFGDVGGFLKLAMVDVDGNEISLPPVWVRPHKLSADVNISFDGGHSPEITAKSILKVIVSNDITSTYPINEVKLKTTNKGFNFIDATGTLVAKGWYLQDKRQKDELIELIFHPTDYGTTTGLLPGEGVVFYLIVKNPAQAGNYKFNASIKDTADKIVSAKQESYLNIIPKESRYITVGGMYPLEESPEAKARSKLIITLNNDLQNPKWIKLIAFKIKLPDGFSVLNIKSKSHNFENWKMEIVGSKEVIMERGSGTMYLDQGEMGSFTLEVINPAIPGPYTLTGTYTEFSEFSGDIEPGDIEVIDRKDRSWEAIRKNIGVKPRM